MIIKPRRDTTANWSLANPVLAEGELAAELMVGGVVKLKIGNGSTPWNDLGYASGGEKGDKGDKGDKGNTGITGPVGPVYIEDVVEITAETYGGKPNLSVTGEPNKMFVFSGLAALIAAGNSATNLILSVYGMESFPANKVSYFNIMINNDGIEDYEVELPSNIPWVTGGNVFIIPAQSKYILNFTVIRRQSETIGLISTRLTF